MMTGISILTGIFIRIAAGVALLVVLYSGEQYIEGRGYDRARAEDGAATEQLKRAAAATLASETNRVLQAEQALSHSKNLQELQDADHQKTVVDLSGRLRALTGAPGRLRDPHAAPAAGCGAGGGGPPGQAASAAGGGAADAGVSGGLLSADLSGLLQRLIRQADDINLAYASCRSDTYTVRGVP